MGNADRGYLADNKPPDGFRTVEHYQCYFDVDMRTVLSRCLATLNPFSSSHADFGTHLAGAGLYGPFWTLTTLIFALFLSSSLAASISAYLSASAGGNEGGAEYEYDFGLLSVAVPLVCSYGLVLPVVLWVALRYLGVSEWSVVDAIAVWGYSMFAWIPVAILAVIPVRPLRLSLVGLAFAPSGYFLVRNVYLVPTSAEARRSPRNPSPHHPRRGLPRGPRDHVKGSVL
ncbi:hypothetical protein K438DRAFT_2020449 [Mycena galopus ATCC 62051]|nr:hypothetical protein K438DRAFT_2020449 [Mycena galopus ATCC 62051]